MKKIYLLAITLMSLPGLAQTGAHGTTGATGAKNVIPRPIVPRYILQFNPAQLRIPGNAFDIGISIEPGNGPASQTVGLLKGQVSWSKYKVEVDGGTFSGGKVKISKTEDSKKGDSLTVNVYAKKWFLGGKGKWLMTQKMSYNYEKSITILTTGNIGRAPGDHVQFGIRTFFDNKLFIDKWFPVKKGQEDIAFAFDGAHLSKSKGDLKIENDPAKIRNDKVKLVAWLAKAPAIRDTLQITLDYVADYQCKTLAPGNGHALTVVADTSFDPLINTTLIKVMVTDSEAHKTYHYRVNPKGGSISIFSKGGDGLDGNNGLDGMRGMDGPAGVVSTSVETSIAADGSSQSTTTTTQGAGGDGGRGTDGDSGGNGNDGGDGGNIVVFYSDGVTPYLDMLKAFSLPGKGGSGGRGGRGGAGGSGGNGNPNGSPGLSGLDGRAGYDGSDGKKGKVVYRLRG